MSRAGLLVASAALVLGCGSAQVGAGVASGPPQDAVSPLPSGSDAPGGPPSAPASDVPLGGDDPSAGPPSPVPPGASPSGASNPSDRPPAPAPQGTPPTGSKAPDFTGALVTIGARTYNFELFGIFGAPCTRAAPDDDSLLIATGFVGGDPNAATFTAHLEPAGHDVEGLASVHFVTLRDPSTDRSWMADHLEFPMEAALEAIPDGFSQIDSVKIEDGYAYGRATFIELGAVRDAWETGGALPAPEPGTFEIWCGP